MDDTTKNSLGQQAPNILHPIKSISDKDLWQIGQKNKMKVLFQAFFDSFFFLNQKLENVF